MINDHLDLIKQNFQEIYCAVFTTPDQPIALSAWGNRIYSTKSSFMGRCVGLFDQAWSSSNAAIHRAVMHTHQLFHAQKKALLPHIKEAEQAVLDWMHEETPNIDIFYKKFQPILKYQEATRPFIKTVLHKNVRLKEFLNAAHLPQPSLFDDEVFYERTGVLSRIYTLICLNGGHLPLKTFKTALENKKLSAEEAKPIKKWLKSIRRLQGTINNRALCKGLDSLVTIWNQTSHSFHTVHIEEHIIKFHRDYFLPDPKHILWRSVLREGIRFYQETLGEALGHKKEGFDNYIAFAIKDTKWALIVPQNRAVLKIRHYYKENPATLIYGLRSHRFIYVDPKNRFGICSRLAPVLDPAPIIGQLHWLASQPHTPDNLSFRDLGLNSEGFLVSIRNHHAVDFNYRSLEQLAFDFANGKFKLYQKVIVETNLRRLPHACFFAACILKGFLQEAFDADKVANNFINRSFFVSRITEDSDVEHGQTLYNEAREMVIELRSIFKSEPVDPLVLESILMKEINTWWSEYCQGGRIWPDSKTILTAKINERLYSGFTLE